MQIDTMVEQVFRVLAGPSGEIALKPHHHPRPNGDVTSFAPRTVQSFVLLPSRRTARWIIPISNLNCTVPALHIYVPNGRGAQWLKSLLVAMLRVGWKGFSRDKIYLASSQPLMIETLVRKVSGEPLPVFSFSLGAPGRFRKVTAQVMRPHGEVLGYIKIPLTSDAATRLRNEAATLELLQGYADIRQRVPRVLFAGAWSGEYILFQSAGPLQPAPVEFGQAHSEFLEMISKINHTERPGKTLVEQVWQRWRNVESKLDSNWTALGTAALQKASRELENVSVPCGISHGDFAPWNSRMSQHGLYVFDWERAENQAPRTWDAFHYHVQTSHLLKRHNLQRLLSDRRDGERACCLLYLVNSVCTSIEELDATNNIALDYRRGILLALLSL
jgi:Phosphotransferase enzyme family